MIGTLRSLFLALRLGFSALTASAVLVYLVATLSAPVAARWEGAT